jgi:DNA-binding MarR family transcriptional regulator
MARDGVDRILDQWGRERPDLDVSPMGVFGRVTRLARLQRAASESSMAASGVNSAEFDVLATLRRSGDPYALTPSQLAEAVMVTSGGMTGRVDRLAAAGLVAREQDPKDRRSVRVRLTPEGRRTVDAALVAHLAAEEELLEPLTAAERERLTLLLRKLLASGGR